jgi:hypothetical protein
MTTGVNPEAGGVSFRGNCYLKSGRKSQRSFDNHTPMVKGRVLFREKLKPVVGLPAASLSQYIRAD